MRVRASAWMSALLVVAAAMVVTADVGPQVTPPHTALPDTNAIPPAMIDAGRKLFHGHGTCFACHGTSLEGGPIAPALKPHAWKDATGGGMQAIFDVIDHGVKGTAMVAHPGHISDADIVSIAAYIWSVGHRGMKP